MKKLAFLLIVLFGIFPIVNGQNSEGHIKYKITASTDNPDLEPMLGMMDGSLLDLYYSDLKSRAEFKMGMMSTTTTIIDMGSRKMLTLISMGKSALVGTIPDDETIKDEQSEDYKISLTNDTKKIIGFTAKKAVITTKDGHVADFWYTEDISAKVSDHQMVKKHGIPGVLLEMTIEESDVKMSFTAISFESKLPKNNKLFEMEIPEGYTVTSIDDIKK